MSSKLLKRFKFGVLAGMFALMQALVPAQAAFAAPGSNGGGQVGGSTGTNQPVWCQYTNMWEAQLGNTGIGNNPKRTPLKSLPAGAPADMYIDEGTGQVYSPNGSFDALKTALNAQCAEQEGPGEPTDPVEPTINYCNPKPQSGSVADWVPSNVNCVTYEVEATECGLFATINNQTQYTTWGVAWSEGQDGVDPVFHYDNALSTDRANPTTFPEDYNGGSVTVHYWLVGPEKDYVRGRAHVQNYWDETYRTITVNTNCEDDEPEPTINYCNPKPQSGSVADWVPSNVNCVTYEVEATECGLFATINNQTQYTTWGVAWSEGQDGVDPVFHYDNALSTDRANPTTFPEDYNGGSVTVHYWLVGPEKDYVRGRAHVQNYWDETYRTITVNTNCEDDKPGPDTEQPPKTDEPAQPQVPAVQGASTDAPRQAAQEDVYVLPQTGATASSNSNPLLILLAGALAYGVLYFAQPRRSAEQI